MATTKVVLIGQGFVDLLLSEPVRADLTRRGRAIAAAAGPGMDVESRPTGKRGRVTVSTATPQAREAEAVDRALTRAIDAGRA